MREKINVWLSSSLLRLSSEYADTISSIISDTVRRWNAERTSRTVELYIGRGFQWIRINGTLVGGLVGFFIYVASRFLAITLKFTKKSHPLHNISIFCRYASLKFLGWHEAREYPPPVKGFKAIEDVVLVRRVFSNDRDGKPIPLKKGGDHC